MVFLPCQASQSQITINRASASISNSGEDLLLSITTTRHGGYLSDNYLILRNIPLKVNQWVKGGCGENWTQARFGPHDDIILGEVQYTYIQTEQQSNFNAKVVRRTSKLVLLDRSGKVINIIDDGADFYGSPTFINDKEIVYKKKIQTPAIKMYNILKYDINKKEAEEISFTNKDGKAVDPKSIVELRSNFQNNIIIGREGMPFYETVSIQQHQADPLDINIQFLKWYRANAARGKMVNTIPVNSLIPISNGYIFKSIPFDHMHQPYWWGIYRYNEDKKNITHLFDDSGVISSFDANNNGRIFVYVIQNIDYNASFGDIGKFTTIIRSSPYWYYEKRFLVPLPVSTDKICFTTK